MNGPNALAPPVGLPSLPAPQCVTVPVAAPVVETDKLPDHDSAAGLHILWSNVLAKRDLSKIVDPEELKRKANRAKKNQNDWTSASAVNNIICLAKYESVLRNNDRLECLVRTDNAAQAEYFRKRMREKGYWVAAADITQPGDVKFRV